MSFTPTFYCSTETSEIPSVTGGVAIPDSSMFMAPGIYKVAGVAYDCTRQGLYRWLYNGQFVQRIVSSEAGSTNLGKLISSLCWNHVPGNQTEWSNHQTVSDAGRYRRWVMRCGQITNFAMWLLPQLGFQCRSVTVITTGPLNGYDDGHTVLETLHGNQWRMWDLTNHCYFKDGNGKHMSTADLVAHLAASAELPESVSLSTEKTYSSDCAGYLDMGLYGSHTFRSKESTDEWYRRIFQVIM